MSGKISPKTGDSSQIFGNLCLLLAGMGMMVIYKKKTVYIRKGKSENEKH